MNPLKENDYKNFWQEDPFDEYTSDLKGFVSDLILATRGLVTPTIFSTWTALFMISSMLKRDLYLKWHLPEKLYPNIFVFLVGPALILGKRQILDFAGGILSNYTNHTGEIETRLQKKVNVHSGNITSKTLFDALHPQKDHYTNYDTWQSWETKKRSHACLCIHDLACFFTDRNLTGTLINLYDCREEADELVHERCGSKILDSVFVTLLGSVTRENLNSKMPPEVLSEEFLSRVNLVHQPYPTRHYLDGEIAPLIVIQKDQEELSKRLAWLATNKNGEYTFNQKAKGYFSLLKRKELGRINKVSKAGKSHVQYIEHLHLLKLSMLIRAQTYDESREITDRDVYTAYRILTGTSEHRKSAISEYGTKRYEDGLAKVRNKLIQERSINRINLLRKLCYARIRAHEIDKYLTHFINKGHIKIELNGMIRHRPSSTGSEVYTWLG